MAGKLFYRHYILHYIYYAKYKYREKYMSHLLRLCVKEESRLRKLRLTHPQKRWQEIRFPAYQGCYQIHIPRTFFTRKSGRGTNDPLTVLF